MREWKRDKVRVAAKPGFHRARLGKDSHFAIALKGRHKEPAPVVSPLQGFESIYTRTQGDDKAREARIVLPWADMFLPLRGAHAAISVRNGEAYIFAG